MANARIARFMTEVAPPQFVSVMRRRRTSKVLDTINEEDRDVCAKIMNDISSNTSPLPKTLPSVASTSSSPSPSPSSSSVGSNYFLKEVHRSFSMFNN